MKCLLAVFFLAASLSWSNVSRPGLWIPSVLSDHMLLQQDQALSIWGNAKPYESLALKFADLRLETQADAQGAFRFQLPELNPGGPFEMSISGEQQSIVIHDVMIGELWLLGGQSNVEFPLRLAKDADLDLPEANDPGLRLFQVSKRTALAPIDEVDGRWTPSNSESAKDFSALGYHFGKELRAALGIPVGLIQATWSGSSAEIWLPRTELEGIPGFPSLLNSWDANTEEKELWSRGEAVNFEVKDLSLEPKDKESKLPSLGSSWTHMEAAGNDVSLNFSDPRAFQYQGRLQGASWAVMSMAFRPKDFRGVAALSFQARGRGAFSLKLDQDGVEYGDSFASPAFQLNEDWQRVRIPLDVLKQGGWGPLLSFHPEAITGLDFAAQVPEVPELPELAYNGMIAPLKDLKLRGVLWYQGESNVARAPMYQALLEHLIHAWRSLWAEPNLAFVVVQLPNFGASCAEPCESSWAALREAQRLGAARAHADLVCAIDLGDPANVHPPDKTRLAERLARDVEVKVYGKKGSASGPEPSSLKQSGEDLVLIFKSSSPLQSADGQALRGFSVEDASSQFHALTPSLAGKEIHFKIGHLGRLKALRYDWADAPDGNLVDAEGLPALPFEMPVAH